MTDIYDHLRNARNPAQFCAVLEELAMQKLLEELEMKLHSEAVEYAFGEDELAAVEWHAIAADLSVIASNFGDGRVTAEKASADLIAAAPEMTPRLFRVLEVLTGFAESQHHKGVCCAPIEHAGSARDILRKAYEKGAK